ncbi:hypothetical protein ACIP8U_01070 [Streptomyces pseudovenezuelae]
MHRLEVLLGLESTGPGFDCSVLSDFRDRLVATGRCGACWT